MVQESSAGLLSCLPACLSSSRSVGWPRECATDRRPDRFSGAALVLLGHLRFIDFFSVLLQPRLLLL